MKNEKLNKYLWEGYDIPIHIKITIESLEAMRIDELRTKYFEVYQYHSNSRNREFLERKIAWKIQANFFGDISSESREVAHKIANLSSLKVHKKFKTNLISIDGFEKIIDLKLKRDSRLPMPGAILTKIHNGKNIIVKVLDKGFEFENKKYNSLSAIAREVMGSNWNGYKFFGL